MADNWPHWAREQAGQTDHGVTTMRVLLGFAAVALIGTLWLGPAAEQQPPTSTTRPCPTLGQHHGTVPAGHPARPPCPPRRPGRAHR